ncbi:MAG: hypothetical protein ACYCTF_05710 [Acidiferrobacter sp.]
MTIHDQATRLTARVAPYLEAIAKARTAGLTWADIGHVFQVKARRLQWAVKHCRYTAEQKPLPEPPSTATKPAPRATAPSTKTAPPLPPPPGQRPVATAQMSELDRIRAEFDQ